MAQTVYKLQTVHHSHPVQRHVLIHHARMMEHVLMYALYIVAPSMIVYTAFRKCLPSLFQLIMKLKISCQSLNSIQTFVQVSGGYVCQCPMHCNPPNCAVCNPCSPINPCFNGGTCNVRTGLFIVLYFQAHTLQNSMTFQTYNIVWNEYCNGLATCTHYSYLLGDGLVSTTGQFE